MKYLIKNIILCTIISSIITFLIVGAILEGDGSTVKYNQVIVSGDKSK